MDDGNRGNQWIVDALYDFETQMRTESGQMNRSELFESGVGYLELSSSDPRWGTNTRGYHIDRRTGLPTLIVTHFDGRPGAPEIIRNNQNPVPWADENNMTTDRIRFHESAHAAAMATGREAPVRDPEDVIYTVPHLMTIPRNELPIVNLGRYAALPGGERGYARERGLAIRNFYNDEEEMDEDGEITEFEDPGRKRSPSDVRVGDPNFIEIAGGTQEEYDRWVDSLYPSGNPHSCEQVIKLVRQG